MKAGDLISVSTPRWTLAQQISGYDSVDQVKPGVKFGYSLDCNTTGSELLVSAPYNMEWDNNGYNREGVVYRITNQGKKFGTIRAIVNANLYDVISILVNGYRVYLRGESV